MVEVGCLAARVRLAQGDRREPWVSQEKNPDRAAAGPGSPSKRPVILSLSKDPVFGVGCLRLLGWRLLRSVKRGAKQKKHSFGAPPRCALAFGREEWIFSAR